MKYRDVIKLILLCFITFGMYAIIWQVKTKNEMNNFGTKIPTAWLLLVPFANIYWLWLYSAGVELITGGKLKTTPTFVLLWLTSFVGIAIIQNEFNVLRIAVSNPAQQTE